MIVNWCPRCETAISDLEVKHKDRDGKLWYFKYPVKGEKDRYVIVATTRPETMLGDTAVAVHPEDERYKDLIGKTVIIPIVNREVPVVADDFVDKEFGTGCVKVTPAHDPNDYECGLRHNLAIVEVIDKHGKMTEAAGEEFKGMDRFEARKKVVEKMEELGLLLKIEPHKHAVGECDRCSTIIEPAVSTQWFVKIKPLAEPALKVVEEDKIKFVPEKWKKTYYEWMRNIHDWCISRQLWWGHRIPAWYCKDCGHTTVAEIDPDKCEKCGSKNIEQEKDVLDTWFSSALWPFSTLGWPEETDDLKTFYPTSVLLTGFDILFFWVARMIMMGLKFMRDVPFYTVYFNALVRDAHGQKMSKSKGNVIDPLEVMEKFGTDALRFTLSIMAVPGTDISLSEERLEGYRAFCNKIWNATRFVLMNIDESVDTSTVDYKNLTLADKWILSKLTKAIANVDENIDKFRFHEAANTLYHFLWHDFCDWYIESTKKRLLKGEENVKKLLVLVLTRVLKLLHPFMPYITEELYQKLPGHKESIAIEQFPVFRQDWVDEVAENEFETLQELISKIRGIRTEKKIPPSKKIEVELIPLNDEIKSLIERERDLISLLVNAEKLECVERFDEEKMYSKAASKGTEIGVSLENLLDKQAERERIEKELAKIEKEIEKVEKKLNNEQFLARAPKEVVEKNRNIYNELKEKHQVLKQNLERLK